MSSLLTSLLDNTGQLPFNVHGGKAIFALDYMAEFEECLNYLYISADL